MASNGTQPTEECGTVTNHASISGVQNLFFFKHKHVVHFQNQRNVAKCAAHLFWQLDLAKDVLPVFGLCCTLLERGIDKRSINGTILVDVRLAVAELSHVECLVNKHHPCLKKRNCCQESFFERKWKILISASKSRCRGHLSYTTGKHKGKLKSRRGS